DALDNRLFFPGIEFVAPYVYPAGLATIFDYLPAGVRLWVDDPAPIESAWEALWQTALERAREAEEARRFFTPADRWFVAPGEMRSALSRLPLVELDPLVGIGGSTARTHLTCYALTDLAALRAHQATPSLKPVADRIRAWEGEGRRCILVVPGAGQRV